MFRLFPYLRSVGLLAVTLAVGLAVSQVGAGRAAAAGVVGFRNDTNQVIVVQCSVTVNNVVRHGKAQMLAPGEVAVDGLIVAGSRRITVYDPKKPKTPLYQDDVRVSDDVLYSIQPDAPAMVVKNPPPATQVKLVPLKLPVVPPARPGSAMPPPSPKPGVPKKP
jgi:hypothetical protein